MILPWHLYGYVIAMLLHFNNDVLMQLTSKMHIATVMHLLQTCKCFYRIRKIILENNVIYLAYKHVNNDECILSTLMDSDILYKADIENNIGKESDAVIDIDLFINFSARMLIKKTQGSSYKRILNTYKLVTFYNIHHNIMSNHNNMCLSSYYFEQVKFYYPRAQSFPVYQFNKFLAYYNSMYTNINLYDIYLCKFFVFNHKYRHLQNTLNKMVIEPPATLEVFVEVCQKFMSYIHSIMSYTNKIKLLKAVMICILFKFIGSVPLHIELKITFKNAIINQSAILCQNIDDLHGIPKYLKEGFKKQFMSVSQRLCQIK
jgi:hypothetical protein